MMVQRLRVGSDVSKVLPGSAAAPQTAPESTSARPGATGATPQDRLDSASAPNPVADGAKSDVKALGAIAFELGNAAHQSGDVFVAANEGLNLFAKEHADGVTRLSKPGLGYTLFSEHMLYRVKASLLGELEAFAAKHSELSATPMAEVLQPGAAPRPYVLTRYTVRKITSPEADAATARLRQQVVTPGPDAKVHEQAEATLKQMEAALAGQ